MDNLWPFCPQGGVAEAYEWQTDILPSRSGEQRIATRVRPRLYFDYEFILNPIQFSRAKILSRALVSKELYVPLWRDHIRVGELSVGVTDVLFSTEYKRFTSGRKAVIWESDDKWEVVNVTAVTTSSVSLEVETENAYTSAYMIPLRLCRMSQAPTYSRGSGEYISCSISFVTTDTDHIDDISNYTQYRGHDVLTDRTIVLSDISESVDREFDVVDSGTGVIWAGDVRSYAYESSVISCSKFGALARHEFISWLHSRRGKCRSFWKPSWNRDIEVTTSIPSSSTTVVIKDIGYHTQGGPKDIMIVKKSGDRLFARILGAVKTAGDTEALTISAPLGQTVLTSDIDFVCFLQLMRLNADRIELRYSEPHRLNVSVPVIEVPAV